MPVVSHPGDKSSIKPAGQPSDWRSIASMVALKHYYSAGWASLDGAWVGCLLSEGNVFVHKPTGKIFLSLGFVHQAALMWQLEEVGDAWKKIALKPVSFCF